MRIIKDLTESTGIHLRPFDPKGRGIKYKDLFSNQKHPAKKARIYDALEPIIDDKRLYIVKTTPHFKEFEDEIKNFPDSLAMDVIDAVSMGCIILGGNYHSTEVLSSGYFKRDLALPDNWSIGKQFSLRR